MRGAIFPMGARTSTLGRWLEPVVAGLWILFLLWTAGIAWVWSFAIGDAALGHWIGNRDLRAALEWLIGIADIAWVILAAANIHLWLAETEGLATARRWALMVGGSAAALGLLSAWSGWPLGEIQYSRQLGMKFGSVPVGLPLLWFAIVIGARQTFLRCWRGANRWPLALGTAALAVLTDFNLEPVAAKLRAFWFWRAAEAGEPPLFTPPWTNYPAWFAVVCVLSFALREKSVVSKACARSFLPVAVFVLLNGVFLAGNLGRYLRG